MNLFLAYVIACIVLALVASLAPRGYENATGFHAGDEPVGEGDAVGFGRGEHVEGGTV